ncbi:MAG: hypothetical protein QOH01_2029 [Verrucomicrobiota bacterium]|jgi:hypothetical protein
MRTSSLLAAAALVAASCCDTSRAQARADAPKPPSQLGAAGLRTFYKGQADARRDIARGRLFIQSTGSFNAPSAAYEKLLRRRYKIRVEIISTDEISDEAFGYLQGYNSIALTEIERRYGKGVLDRAFTESEKKASGK